MVKIFKKEKDINFFISIFFISIYFFSSVIFGSTNDSLQNCVSFFGSTGLINIPSAKGIKVSKVNFGLHSFKFKINYGFPCFFPAFEAGIWLDTKEQFSLKETLEKIGFNVKCQMFSQSKNFVDLGIGMYNNNSSLYSAGETHNNPVYLVANKLFKKLEILLGVGINFSTRKNFNKSKEILNGLFGGITKTIFDSSSIFLVEYDSKNINLGLRFSLSSKWKIDIFVIEMVSSNNKFDYENIVFGINYSSE